MSKLLFIATFLLEALSIFSQSYPVTWIGVDDGLSQGFIYQIKEDKKGFLWMGTRMGLNRYDGYEFRTYDHQASNQYALSGNDVSTIFSDENEFLFIHNDAKGMDIYFPLYDCFIQFNENQSSPFHLSSNVVYWVIGDEKGNYYILTKGGLHHISIKKREASENNTYFESMEEAFLYHYSVNNEVLAISDEVFKKWKSGYMFFENERYYFFGSNCTETVDFAQPETPILDPLLEHSRKRKKPCYIVYSDFLRKEVLIYDDGVFVDNQFIKSDVPLPPFRNSITADRMGSIWISQTNSLLRFDLQNRTFNELPLAVDNPQKNYLGLSSLYFDKSGVLWIGTVGRGLYKLNTQPKKFNSVTQFEQSKSSIYGLSENLSGNVIAECEGTVIEIDITNGKYLRTLKSKTPHHLKFSVDASRNAIEVSPGVFYIVQYSNIWMWDENLQEVHPIYRDPKAGLYSSFLLDDDKNIWICSSEGLIQFNIISQHTNKFPLPIQTASGFNSWRLTGMIYRAPQSNDIWICSFEGLLKFSIPTSSWKTYRSENGMSQNDVLSVCADPLNPSQFLWIGTSGSGFSRLDLTNETFEHFSRKDGLSNNYVYGILSDDSGRLWMSTNKGISCFYPKDRTFINYLKQEGLQGNEFNRFAYLKMKNGTFVFGGVNGLTYFRPEDITLNPTVPNIVVTSVKINNSAQHPLLRINAPFINALDLRHDENNISFEFAALDYTNPSLNRYRYKMVGVSENWLELGALRSINFSNLSPGSYQLILNGSNSDGVWSTKTHSILIHIQPPWWKTWWFLTLIGIAMLFITWGAVRYRINKIKELQNVRDRIARDLHDEIGSTLSSISIYNEIVKEKIATSTPEALPIAQRIAVGTQRVMESMSDIVWAINSRNDSFENLISRMRSTSQEMNENTNFDISFHAEDQLNMINLGMEERKNIYLIFKESINNSIKYSGAKHICIDLSLVKNEVILKMTDDGKGFDESKIKPGNGLVNMRKRAEIINAKLEIKSIIDSGTQVILTFPIR